MSEERKSPTDSSKGITQEELKAQLMKQFRIVTAYTGLISEDYKKVMAAINQLDILNEIYLCACDRVPIGKVQQALKKPNVREALQSMRYYTVASQYNMIHYEKDIVDIKKHLTAIENKNKVIEEMVSVMPWQHLADTYQAEKEGKAAGTSPEKSDIENTIIDDKPEENSLDIPDLGIQDQQEQVEEKTVQASSTTSFLRRLFGPLLDKKDLISRQGMKRQSDPKKTGYMLGNYEVSEYVDQLMGDHTFSDEQMMYILDCIEEGVPIDIVQAIASPKFPVSVMKRLRKIEERHSTDQ